MKTVRFPLRWTIVLLVLFLQGKSCVSVFAQINTDRMMTVGRNALYYDDYVLSIQYFNRVIYAKPHLHEPFFYRALAKFYLEDFTGAEADCNETIHRNPFYPSTYELRGLARINLGKFALASEDYQQATIYTPENKALWHNWVLCNIQLDRLQLADSISNTIISKWPKYVDGYVLKAQIRLAQKDTLAAEAYADSALYIAADNAPSLRFKASMLLSRKEWQPADSLLTKSIELQPRDPRNYINRALARYHLKNLRGAMSD